MSESRHVCSLHVADTSGLPKLPPNVGAFRKLMRNMKKCVLLTPHHYRCNKLFRNLSAVLQERKKHARGPHYFVIHPLSPLNIVIQVMFLIVWLCIFFTDTPLAMYNVDMKVLTVYILFPVHLVLILFHFNIGYIDKKTKTIIMEPKKIILRYLRTHFIFDVVSTYGFTLILQYIIQNKLITKVGTKHHMIIYNYVLRMAAFMPRLNASIVTLKDLFSNMRLRNVIRLSLAYAVRTYMYLHVLTCVMYFVSTMHAFHLRPGGNEPWVVVADIMNKSFFQVYGESFLLTLCLFLGISHRYNLTLFHEQICAVIIILFGRLYTLYLLADVLSLFGIAGMSESMYEKNMASLQEYMNSKDLPNSLKKRVIKYYKFKFQRRYFREHEIVSELSENLRTELFLFSARHLVQKVEILKRLPSVTLGALVASMKSETFSAGDIIIYIGSDTDELCFISTGTVALVNCDNNEVCHLEDGDVFGISCLFYDLQQYTIVAVETTDIFKLKKKKFLEFFEPHPQILSDFYSRIKERFNNLKLYEERLSKSKVDLLAELYGGTVLGRRRRRLTVVE